jgi:hypothetical protein
MAAFSTIMAFDFVKFGGDSSTRDFACNSAKISGFANERFYCFPLHLSNEIYFEDPDTEGWAKAIRVGAVFGIVAAATGGFALALLFTATCFSLKPRRLFSICVLQAIACFFSILSLVAGTADICEYLDYSSDSCEKGKNYKMAEGGLFMLTAFFLHIASIVMNYMYYQTARQQQSRTVTGGSNIPPSGDAGALLVPIAPPQEEVQRLTEPHDSPEKELEKQEEADDTEMDV